MIKGMISYGKTKRVIGSVVPYTNGEEDLSTDDADLVKAKQISLCTSFQQNSPSSWISKGNYHIAFHSNLHTIIATTCSLNILLSLAFVDLILQPWWISTICWFLRVIWPNLTFQSEVKFLNPFSQTNRIARKKELSLVALPCVFFIILILPVKLSNDLVQFLTTWDRLY